MTAKNEKLQVEKFREAAHQLETGDDEKRFDEWLVKIAKVPLVNEQKPKPKKSAFAHGAKIWPSRSMILTIFRM